MISTMYIFAVITILFILRHVIDRIQVKNRTEEYLRVRRVYEKNLQFDSKVKKDSE